MGSTRDLVARLMESGNRVVQDANDESGHFLWQSFDYPCDTLLPSIKLGKNFVMGLERHLSPWKSSNDPAPVRFNSPTSWLQWQEKRDSASDLGIVNWTSSAGYKPDRVSLKKEKKQFTAKQRSFTGILMHKSEQGSTDKTQKEDLELPLFDLTVIADSTNNFSINNKIGEAGFGPVYKGTLEGGQEIAMKWLSKNSSQGLDEFNGYMSLEYATDALFSVKSDVFSFGILVLEIVSGKKNRGFYHPGHCLNLLGHAWNLYKEEKPLELIDDALRESCYQTKMLRSIHVGLLCVQECPANRPNMSFVVMMLGSEVALPQAKQLGFFTTRNVVEPGYLSSKEATTTSNEITITMLSGR
ncbi:unnamed protein product [Camellia sinensis]